MARTRWSAAVLGGAFLLVSLESRVAIAETLSKTVLIAFVGPASPDPEDLTNGKAKRKILITTEGTLDRFKARIEIPPPANPPRVAPTAHLFLSRDGLAYAACVLDPDAADADPEIEFTVAVEVRNGVFEAEKGACDVDLGKAGVTDGVPDVHPGDTATAFISSGTPEHVVSGRFVEKEE